MYSAIPAWRFPSDDANFGLIRDTMLSFLLLKIFETLMFRVAGYFTRWLKNYFEAITFCRELLQSGWPCLSLELKSAQKPRSSYIDCGLPSSLFPIINSDLITVIIIG